MCDQMLTIAERVVKPEWVILDFCGSLSNTIAKDLDEVTRKLKATNFRNIVINLTHVDYIDGTGLKLLLIFFVSLRRLDRKIVACGLNEDVSQIFQLTRMDGFVQIFKDESQALS